MGRMRSINYRRVTFSFPCAVLDELRLKIDKNSMSSYVADAVKRDLLIKKELEEDTEEFIRSVRKFREEMTLDLRNKLQIATT